MKDDLACDYREAELNHLWVTNGKNANFMLGASFGPAISESLRNRIAYAITQRYPDLE